MENIIKQINQSIDSERNRLKGTATRDFDAIISTMPLESRSVTTNNTKMVKTPGLTYILYLLAVVFVILMISDGFKLLFGILAFGCAYGGYMFAKNNRQSTKGTTSPIYEDLSSIKNKIISKGINAVKKITNEWDVFMEAKQKEVHAFIDASPLNEGQKYDLSSKIFSYEVIDINLSDLMSMINSATSIPEARQKVESFKSKFLLAIDEVANNQELKYDSLLDSRL